MRSVEANYALAPLILVDHVKAWSPGKRISTCANFFRCLPKIALPGPYQRRGEVLDRLSLLDSSPIGGQRRGSLTEEPSIPRNFFEARVSTNG